MATEYNISLMRGDTFIGFQFQCLINDTPLNLTGASIKCEIRQNNKTGKRIFLREIGSGITVINENDGLAQFDTLKWTAEAGEFYYDIEVTDNNNVVRTFVTGIITANQDVTK